MNMIGAAPSPASDLSSLRADFPILGQQIRGKPFVYLDSAASAQKPRAVIDAMVGAMETQYANIHRGVHWMSERTTETYEATRDAVARLLHAREREEVVFVRNSTEAINLVAHSYGRGILRPGQAVVISAMEHHSNLVPWQMLRDDGRGIELRIAPVTRAGELDMAAYEALLADGKVGLVAITHMSNVLGTYTPAERIVQLAHAAGAKVMLDGSQAIVHRRVDVQALDCDFYAFTGHKLYGPTGIGVLWARREILEAMPPFMGGGDMIASVGFDHSTWARVPHKFEAGTPAILEAIGLRAAIEYVEAIGYDRIAAHEVRLTEHALSRLSRIEGLEVIGAAQDRGGVVSFTMAGAHPHSGDADLAHALDAERIDVRILLVDQDRLERGHVGVHRHVVFAEVGVHGPPGARIHDGLFVQREADAPDHPAVILARHQPRIDDAPGREGADEPRAADLPEVGVDLHLGEDRAVGMRRIGVAARAGRALAAARDRRLPGAGEDLGVGFGAALVVAAKQPSAAGLDARIAGTDSGERWSSVASRASFATTSSPAACAALPAVAMWPEPPAMPPSGRSDDPIRNSTLSMSSPTPSAATWWIAVQAPWPMSIAPISTRAVPSARISALASAAKIRAGKVAVPMPQPTRNPSASRMRRGSRGRLAQPNRSAPLA